MGSVNVKAGEKLAILGRIDPQTVANTEVFTDVVDLSQAHQVIAIAQLGNMAAETVDFKCYTCDSDGNNAAALTGKAITQLAAHATNNDNVQVSITVRSDDLIATSKRYVKFGLVTGGATGGPASAVVLGVDARFDPASAINLTSVKQTI